MRTIINISSIALAAALLVPALPAAAAVVNLGNNAPLVDANGGGGGLVSIGGGGASNTNVSVGTGAGANGANASTNLLGSPATANVDLVDPNANTATVDLGNTLGNGGTDATVDLFGNNQPTVATVDLGGAGGTNADALVDLFGTSGNGTNASVNLGTGGGNANGATQRQARKALFGTNNGAGTDDSAGDGNTDIASGDSDTNGTAGLGADGTVAPVLMASLDAGANGACFSPNHAQMTKLTDRHDYTSGTFSKWAGVSGLKLVDVGLCANAGASLASDANVAKLQAFVSANPVIRSNLAKAGRSPSDVIAVDKTGKTLVVYLQ